MKAADIMTARVGTAPPDTRVSADIVDLPEPALLAAPGSA